MTAIEETGVDEELDWQVYKANVVMDVLVKHGLSDEVEQFDRDWWREHVYAYRSDSPPTVASNATKATWPYGLLDFC